MELSKPQKAQEAKMIRRISALLGAIGVHGSLSAEQKHDIATAGYQALPGVAAAGGARVIGLPLSDWLVLVSMLFVALQAAYLIWKWRRDARRDQERQEDRRNGIKPKDSDLAGLGECE